MTYIIHDQQPLLGDSLFSFLNPTHYRQREIEIEHADALNKKPILIGTEDHFRRRKQGIPS